ncbi:MAG TPA: hypothetical protein VGC89_04185, partial [Pyrinomonadaceae bacterium]
GGSKGSGSSKGGGGKKGAGKKSGGGGGKGKSLIPEGAKRAVGSILSAAASGALKGAVEELVPQVEKAAGVKGSKGSKGSKGQKR